MSKRFTSTEKWDDPWFRGLEDKYKILWCYLCDTCDNAGIWKVDFETANYRTGCVFNYEESLKQLNSDRVEGEFRIKEVHQKRYWFLYGFYQFQWGTMGTNSVLLGIRKNLLKHKFYSEISKYIPSLNGGSTEGEPSPNPPKVKVKVKIKVKDKDKGNTAKTEYQPDFEVLWKQYPISRRDDKRKCYIKYQNTVKSNEEKKKIAEALSWYLNDHPDVKKGFIKLATTWFNQWQTCWENLDEHRKKYGTGRLAQLMLDQQIGQK